ncbi:MAG: hypothetical protein LQ348_007206 [Seirophora lacunosa]|nr:MAG: hypothetical protein LQ348_007206 [Seirophora lacunosa]
MGDNKASAMASSRAAWLVDRTKNLRSKPQRSANAQTQSNKWLENADNFCGEHPQRGIRWDYGNNKVDRDRQFSSADDVRRQLQKKSAVV